MKGGLASAGFGETLWRHLYLSNCRNELPWKQSCSSVSPVTHSSGDPPCRGPEKTTRVGSPPVTECSRSEFRSLLFHHLSDEIDESHRAITRHSAIGNDRRSVDVARILRCQKEGHVHDLFDVPQSFERNFLS